MSVSKKLKEENTTFVDGTVARTWEAPESGRMYRIRCAANLNQMQTDPRFPVQFRIETDEDDQEEDEEGNFVGRLMDMSVFGGVWTDEDNLFVGFWAEGDDGCDFFVRSDFEHRPELDLLTADLTAKIFPGLIDSFDDGRGGERDGIPIAGEVFDAMRIARLQN